MEKDQDYLKYSYSVNRFANAENSVQLSVDTNALGTHWIKVNNENEITDYTRGIYLVSLVSPYRLTALGQNYDFRNVLYINKTEDIRHIFRVETLLTVELIDQFTRAYEDISFQTLRELELWFLPIPKVSMALVDNLLMSLRAFFNPPYNPITVKPVKASTVTNSSAPAF